MKKLLLTVLTLVPWLTCHLFSAGTSEIVSIGFSRNCVPEAIPGNPARVTVAEGEKGQSVLAVEINRPGRYTGKFSTVWRSAEFPLSAGRYELRARVKLPIGYGMKLELHGLNSQQSQVWSTTCYVGSPPTHPDQWQWLSCSGTLIDRTCTAGVLVLRLPAWVPQRILVEQIKVVSLPLSNRRHAPPVYPVQVAKPLSPPTPADVPGPDGWYYPDFSYAGARTGQNILDTPEAPEISLSDFGGTPGGNIDRALARALAALPKTGGIIRLAPGRYTMSRFLTINRDRVALRGAGSDRTRVVFDYTPPAGTGIDFYCTWSKVPVPPGRVIHVIALPRRNGATLAKIELKLDGRTIGEFTRKLHSGGRSWLKAKLPDDCSAGEHMLQAAAKYSDGKEYRRELKLNVNPKSRHRLPNRYYQSMLNFQGRGENGPSYKLAQDAERGATWLQLESVPDNIRPGDLICLTAPETERFRKQVGNTCRWGISRQVLLTVAEVDGRRLRIDQPVRLDYPVIDGATVRKFTPIRGAGVEGITFEMKHDLWFSSLGLVNAVDGILRDVKVIKTGRNPVEVTRAKFCTISNCEFDDAWNHGGGKSAYVGFDSSYDCLMEKVTVKNMRHAPIVQWSSSGNVIRESDFFNSDAQWHAGYPHENLFENCRITIENKQTGAYGHAFFASGPGDSSHGPSGPRNVVYNCDTRSLDSGIMLTGNNENWLIVYNRFQVRNGHGIQLGDNTPDTIIAHNVVQLDSPEQAILMLGGADYPGLTFNFNTGFGRDSMLKLGMLDPDHESGNRIAGPAEKFSRPDPPVPSLYLHQKKTSNRDQPPDRQK